MRVPPGDPYTPAGTRVDVHVRRHDDDVQLEVADDGPGMAPHVTARVFERFSRADPSRARTGGTTGSGLGLSIGAASVGASGGTVDVDSDEGRGSRFVVRLPAADAD